MDPKYLGSELHAFIKEATEKASLANTYMEDGALYTAAGLYQEVTGLLFKADSCKRELLGMDPAKPKQPEESEEVRWAETYTRVMASIRFGKPVFGITHVGAKIPIVAYRLKLKREFRPRGKSAHTGQWLDLKEVVFE